MEIQKPLVDQVASSIFYRNARPVKFRDHEIRTVFTFRSEGRTEIRYEFTDKEVQEEYDDFYKRIVGPRDFVEFKKNRITRVKLSQLDVFLNRYIKGTLHTRFQEFVTKDILKALIEHPYRSQDGKGMKAKVIARYFNPTGTGTWYITEMADVCYTKSKDPEYITYDKVDRNFDIKKTHDIIFFGLAEMGDGFEWGSFSMKEIAGLLLPYGMEIERDEHIEPVKMTIEECFRMYNEKLMGY